MPIWLIYVIAHILCVVPTYLALKLFTTRLCEPKYRWCGDPVGWNIGDRAKTIFLSILFSTLLLCVFAILAVIGVIIFSIMSGINWIISLIDWDKPAKW